MDSLYLRLNAAGVVVGSLRSPDPQPDGAVAAQNLAAVDEATYAAGRAKLGACKLVDGALQDCATATIPPYVDPAVPAPVSGDTIVGVLSRAQAAQCDVRDLARIAWRDDVPATNNKLGRIAKAIGSTADALRAAAAAS